ncbi:alpha-mannosidase [Gracilibacillus orientalis]|uniref:alpha-mannosidase n=1 Tax=Gracilibacillus orientalis TaxID=334253 RepID=A0A1I4JRI4_9BACI|nr:alpha-mannosidase [Gracilibacillus orientalis]SFL69152.1 alpha-mannosidase [Gracilibacillus orientalis]
MKRIHRLIRLLRNNQYIATKTINNWEMNLFKYEGPENYQPLEQENSPETADIGGPLIESGVTAFLNNHIEIPNDWSSKDIGIIFKAGGPGGISSHYEALMNINGEPIQGFDRNRSFCFLAEHILDRSILNIEIELFNPVGIPEDSLRGFNQVASAETAPPSIFLEDSALVLVNRAVESFVYTLQTACNTLALIPESDTRYSILYKRLEDLANEWKIPDKKNLMNQKELLKQEQSIQSLLKEISGYREGTIRAIGQSHIDVAWLWPLKETIRKASRTFSTACTLLDEYEEFEYAQSQPQLFEYLKNYYPKIYERVKQQIKAGRFEIIGGMWVEPDLNIPSGESLVRQLLYGKQYFKEEFGEEPKVEWLPDTFGYCASLPQILKKADTEYFMTTKLNWNDTNRFPYDLFHWEGIDGTTILSYLHTILGQQTNPKDIKETWNDFNQKNDHNERMLVYGYGDGGGGVTREMIEQVKRSKSLPGLPNVKFSKVHDFFGHISQQKPALPKWYGDLYLELHRGTYTTHAKTKKYNRQVESLLRNVEIWHSFVHLLIGTDYPAQRIKKLWKLILLNQFHDIVPGTSIEPVYELSDQQYQEVMSEGESLQREAIEQIKSRVDTNGPGEPLIIFNSLGWDRDRLIKVNGDQDLLSKTIVDEEGNPYPKEYVRVDNSTIELHAFISNVPQFGYKTVWVQEEEGNILASSQSLNGKWETVNYIVEFTEQGFISRLYDKQCDKEIIQSGEVANELQLFDDLPTDWDAWDIDPNFASQKIDNMKLLEETVHYTSNLTDELHFKWKLNESIITQKIIFHHYSKLIDFETEVDWKETNKLLKVAFPVNVYSSQATYEIPFGTIDRPTHNNTTWEQAQYEVCGQRWADLSEGTYGVSLLNDSKYGYDIKGQNIRLSLLRSPKWPDQSADTHRHQFVYSLYPHQGDWKAADTVKKGHELNTRDLISPAKTSQGNLLNSSSFIRIESESAILDAVKLAENEKGLIVRLYEAEGSEVSTTVTLPEKVVFQETNLLEKTIDHSLVSTDSYKMKLKPYEICTYQIRSEKG